MGSGHQRVSSRYNDEGGLVFEADDGTDLLTLDPDGTATPADDSITFAAAKVSISSEQTATGSAQNVAHGLGTTPSGVLVVPQSHSGTPDTGAFDIAQGTHTATNVVVTVSTGLTFVVFAWA